MFRQAGSFFDCTEWIACVGWQLIESTLVAGVFIWPDNSCLTLESLSTPVNQNSVDLWLISCFIEFYQLMHLLINPTSGFDIIESCDDHRKLFEEVVLLKSFALNRLGVVRYLNIRATIHYELGSYFRLVPRNVFFSEQELSVEVCHIYAVEINYRDFPDTGES